VADLSAHGRHDRFAIAAAVSDGVAPAMARSCPLCKTLHGDLLSIRVAIRHAWTPRRPRDMVLSPDAAARVRPGPWRRLIDAIGTSHDVVTRPVGISLAGLGLAGLLLSAVSIGPAGTSAESAAETYGVRVAGDPEPPTDARVPEPGAVAPTIDPLAVVSVGFVAAGGAVFGARRLARRPRAMR